MSPLIITIEGNISAGKSTLVENLEKRFANRDDILLLLEPVGIWEAIRDENGLNMLQKFYQDPKTYSFAFQVMAFHTRKQRIEECLLETQKPGSEIKVILMERSLDADRHVFAQMLFDSGMIGHCEFQIYQMMAKESYRGDKVIWLNVKPEECFRRSMIRNREGEQSISFEYLEKCHRYHEQWLIGKENVLVLEDNTELDKVERFII